MSPGRHDAEGLEAGFAIRLDGFHQGINAHPELRVGGNLAHALAPHPNSNRALLDGGVRLLGGVQSEPPGGAFVAGLGIGHLARRGDGVHRTHGRRVVNDSEEFLRQAQPLAQPAHGHHLQLRVRRELFHTMALVFRAADNISPSTPGGEAELGK